MALTSVTSNFGDVSLRAAASIMDGSNDAAGADITGNNITLTADFGGLGDVGDNLEIDSAHAGTGVLTATSGKDAHISEAIGDLSINTIDVEAGTAFITAPHGSILDGNTDPDGFNLLSGTVYLVADQDIATALNPLTSKMGLLQAASTKGSTYIENTGALVVGKVVDPSYGMNAGGDIHIGAASPVTVTLNITGANVLIVAWDDPAEEGKNSIDVKNGVTVTSTTGTIKMLAGNNVTIEKGATVNAATALIIQGDFEGDVAATRRRWASRATSTRPRSRSTATSRRSCKFPATARTTRSRLHPTSLVGHTRDPRRRRQRHDHARSAALGDDVALRRRRRQRRRGQGRARHHRSRRRRRVRHLHDQHHGRRHRLPRQRQRQRRDRQRRADHQRHGDGRQPVPRARELRRASGSGQSAASGHAARRAAADARTDQLQRHRRVADDQRRNRRRSVLPRRQRHEDDDQRRQGRGLLPGRPGVRHGSAGAGRRAGRRNPDDLHDEGLLCGRASRRRSTAATTATISRCTRPSSI